MTLSKCVISHKEGVTYLLGHSECIYVLSIFNFYICFQYSECFSHQYSPIQSIFRVFVPSIFNIHIFIQYSEYVPSFSDVQYSHIQSIFKEFVPSLFNIHISEVQVFGQQHFFLSFWLCLLVNRRTVYSCRDFLIWM